MDWVYEPANFVLLLFNEAITALVKLTSNMSEVVKCTPCLQQILTKAGIKWT